jgi:hypothetical protein
VLLPAGLVWLIDLQQLDLQQLVHETVEAELKLPLAPVHYPIDPQ